MWAFTGVGNVFSNLLVYIGGSVILFSRYTDWMDVYVVRNIDGVFYTRSTCPWRSVKISSYSISAIMQGWGIQGGKKKTSPQIVHSLSGKGIKHKEISYKYQSRSVDKVQKAVVVGVRSPSVQRELPKRSDTFSWVVRGKKRKTSSERHLKGKEPGYKAVCFFLHIK